MCATAAERVRHFISPAFSSLFLVFSLLPSMSSFICPRISIQWPFIYDDAEYWDFERLDWKIWGAVRHLMSRRGKTSPVCLGNNTNSPAHHPQPDIRQEPRLQLHSLQYRKDSNANYKYQAIITIQGIQYACVGLKCWDWVGWDWVGNLWMHQLCYEHLSAVLMIIMPSPNDKATVLLCKNNKSQEMSWNVKWHEWVTRLEPPASCRAPGLLCPHIFSFTDDALSLQ